MRFQPKTEAQLVEGRLIPDETECDFEVMSSTHAVSKKGNEMIALKLRVFHQDREAHVYDYLMETMGFKLLHFCEAANLTEKYKSGELRASDCENATGKAVIGIEDSSGTYKPKNVVIDYIGHRETAKVVIKPEVVPSVVKTVTATVITTDDDVPF